MRFCRGLGALLAGGTLLGEAVASDLAGLVESSYAGRLLDEPFELYAELIPPEPARREKVRVLLAKAESGNGPSNVEQFVDYLMDLLVAAGNNRKDKSPRLDALVHLVLNNDTFFKSTLPFMASLANRIEDLFPRGLPFISRQRPAVHLRRIQILALLSAAFLGTLPHNQRLLLSKRYGIPYDKLHLNKLDMHHRGFFQRRAKVASFLNYVEGMRASVEGCWRQMVARGAFEQAVCTAECICVEAPAVASSGVAFRVAPADEVVGFYFIRPEKAVVQGPPGVVVETEDLHVDDLVRRATPLSEVVVDLEGDITKADGEVQVDFADKYVGGLSMQRDDVAQEELLFHLRPELLAVMLITRALNDDEAIVIKGAETFSSHTGYELSFDVRALAPETFPAPPAHWSFHGLTPLDALGRRDVTLAVIDALQFARGSSTEYKTKSILREIQKAVLGFSGDPLESMCKAGKAAVATGKWGCEIFGGDFELKALLQWIAASAVGRPLHLTLFGDKTKAAVGKVLDEFRERFKTVKDLYDAIQMAKHTRKEYGGLWKAMQKP